ncbi:GTPase-activating protein IML1 KNAG_0B06870 [Huiozyma naganishii CBS 8797]|uniref:Vacuolar membrane-associated protein IML1 n=1 Tax=Huiozyma naganishii (strain ATCC MYA-139 / BCRC 22969 / CBS 8797 / KCTC 17520 / NBRC 10181 / NCYC 3082 / Yp74L-3) TaxID=1071383 RepID=J7S5F2_HUIN7|nr:hypothetical protein KNAG_0B06870 [Kazachstania naganishii CBS 8797]CCK69111.1 hypothetical protein KNAG_0B06870 [Kazachstania naganishii CBS 8797]
MPASMFDRARERRKVKKAKNRETVETSGPQPGIARSSTPRTPNTTNANTLTLSSGNLLVDSSGGTLNIHNNTLKVGAGAGAGVSTGAGVQETTSHPTALPLNGDRKLETRQLSLSRRLKITSTSKRNVDQDTQYSLTTSGRRKALALELGYHESRVSHHLVLLHLDELPMVQQGDLCELKTYTGKEPSAKNTGKKIFFIAHDFPEDLKRRCQKNSTQRISIMLGQLQNLIDLPARSKVWIKVKEKETYAADVIEIHIKDCALNRGDMWVFSGKLLDTCVFAGQKVQFMDSTRGTVKGVFRDGKKILSSYVGEKTRVVFRSESARLMFLIQITEEMWHFDESGEQLFQKMINSFFPKIFKRWKNIDTHHSITIAFAVSMDLSDSSSYMNLKPGEKLKNPSDIYRIVVDQVNIIHWVEILETLGREFVNLRQDLLNVKSEKGYTIVERRFAPIIKSNFLEMINFASTILADPFKQVDLRHTTTHVMIISPGRGLYDVDFDLLNLTGKKLLSLEMTMDLICLSRAPLHIIPLFRYLDYEKKLHYCIPKWLSIFFWNDSTKDTDQWHPRSQIYDLQMMGLTDNEIVKQAEIGYLTPTKNIESVSQMIRNFESTVFKHPELKESKRTDVLKVEQSLGPETNGEPTGVSKNLLWNNLTFSQPAINGIQKPEVTADIYTADSPTENETPNKSPTESRSSRNVSRKNSLAVNTLRGLTQKSSVKDFTRRIINKFTQSSEQKSPVEETAPISSAGSVPKDLSNFKKNPSEQNLTIMKNLSIFEPRIKETSSENQTETVSHPNSLVTENSSRFSNALNRYPFANEEIKLEVDDHIYIFNETWVEITNPSVPVSGQLADKLIPVRWKDVWPKYVAKKYSKWRSFSTPAELPVTVSNFPSVKDFEENFIFRNHSVTLNIDQEAYNQTYIDLLRNMIYSRLICGFQLCVGEQVELIEKQIDKDAPLVAKYIDNRNWNMLKVYTMIDSEIHRITCGNNGVIDVQRYLRKNETSPFDQVPSHIPLVKTRYENEYHAAKIDPIHTFRESLNWNQIDQALAGYGDFIVDKKWNGFRAKFVLLPATSRPSTFSIVINGKNETLSPEELRLEGLRRVIASITKSRLKTEQEKKMKKSKIEEIQPEVTFYTGSLFNFISEQRDSLEKSDLNYSDTLFVKDTNLLSKDMELYKLAHEMQHGISKLRLVNRTWHWKRHKNCFVGSEMVNWLIRNFSDIHTRDEATEYGQEIMSKGLFVHVLNKHSFLDGHYFYQFSPEYIIDSNQVNKLNRNNGSLNETNQLLRKTSSQSIPETAASVSLVTSHANSSTGRDDQTVLTRSNTLPERPIVVLSNSVLIDVDPLKKSYRQETCTVHYDRVHNPDHCFHIRLEWLATTPKLLDDLIANWSRICERYGLRLIEIPWEELCTIPSMNPFHSFVEISLAINPWKDPEFYDPEIFSKSKFYYHTHLLRHSGFMLDNRASTFLQEGDVEFEIRYSWGRPQFKYAQFIHNTGTYIAEIRENGDLFLAPNNIHISRVSQGNIHGKIHTPKKNTVNAQAIMETFRKTCTNYEMLRNEFLEIKEIWDSDQSTRDESLIIRN